ncbi:hypothetical protein Sjap_024031 [Stephania japonica]|uniref:Uncharacterized protein n=1 Tax=Stephania japonica TaxID=461633 RepID=A0AAP0HL42_9MAGN
MTQTGRVKLTRPDGSNLVMADRLSQTGSWPDPVEAPGRLLTYGRRIPFTELFARIDAVDTKTVKRVANRFIFDKDVAISAMGPIQSLPDYNWFRRRTYWLRY